jgi:hypothetical protein
MSPIEVNNDQTLFRCPNCDACRWQGDLILPGGLIVTCMACNWSEKVSEIERRMREVEL